jgi:acetoin utilization protein AcuB
MRHLPLIKSVMTAFPYAVDVAATVSEAQGFMREHRIRHLPVTRAGEVVGIVSDRDLKLVLGPDFAYPEGTRVAVGEVMISPAYIVDLDAHLDDVLTHMATHHLGAAIVTRKGRLAGVFTGTDACHHFAEFLRDQFRRSGGDDAA